MTKVGRSVLGLLVLALLAVGGGSMAVGGVSPVPWSVSAAESRSTAGLPRPVLAADPGSTGRYPVDVSEYNLGDEAVYLPAFGSRSELAGRVYTPRGAVGRRPLVLFLHGLHDVCYGDIPEPGDLMNWPCPKGAKSIPSYRGYDAPAKALASHGYLVVSISANAINLQDFDFLITGAQARAELVLAHLELWKRWSTRGDGPFGRRYVGKVDLHRIGLMGHSRGGAGVVRAVALNAERGGRFGIRAVLPLAPGDELRLATAGTAMSVILPYCDGDVSDLSGQRHYDDTRYALTGDPVARSTVLVMGANHNFFNTEWTPGRSVAESQDDWDTSDKSEPCGAGTTQRLTPVEQEAVGRAYIAGFFRLELGGESALLPLLDGSNARAGSAGRAIVHVVAQAPTRNRFDLARLDAPLPAGAVTGSAKASLCGGPGSRELCAPGAGGRLPHWTSYPLSEAAPTTTVTKLTWSARSGRVLFTLPPRYRDLRRFSALTLRAAPGAGVRSDLTVRLRDGRGKQAGVAMSTVSDALTPLPGSLPSLLPKIMLRTVRIPWASVASLDLRDLRSVEILTDRVAAGTVYLSDLSFSTPALSRPPVLRPPVLSVGDVDIKEGNTGSRSADFVVRLSRPSLLPVTFYAETEGSTNVVGPVQRKYTLPPGTTKTLVRIPVHPNQRDGPDESFDLVLSVPTEAIVGDGLGAGVVRDDDPAPTVTIGPGVGTEGRGSVRFPVKLSAASDRGVYLTAELINGTAKLGADFLSPDDDGEGLPESSVYPRIEAGQDHGEIVIPLKNDRLREPDERFSLRITAADGGLLNVPTTRIGTIHDND